MEIHTFRAASLQEALMLVRHELGPAASVLQTREISARFFGLLGKRCIEVQASRDAQVLRRLPTASTVSGTASVGGTDAAHPAVSSGWDVSEDDASVQSSVSLLDHLQGEPSEAEDASGDRQGNALSDGATPANYAVHTFQDHRAAAHASGPRAHSLRGGGPSRAQASAAQPTNYLSPAMFEVFTEMLDAEVDPEAARTMLQEVAGHCTPEQLNDAWLIKGRLCQIIQQRVHVAAPIDLSSGTREIIALVGPTGVGKTTTLAKLAAGFHFDQGTSVGFVTLDTFRLGAVDQLQKYADLLGAACEVVSAPDQMLPALQRLAHCQLIFIDTAGRSPRDRAQLEMLGEYLRVASPTQIHLVLSAASAQAHARSALEHFAALRPTHLLLTKLDESTGLGSWYRLLSTGTWPLSYVTTGQHVPEDILVANRRRIASLILGQTNHLTWK